MSLTDLSILVRFLVQKNLELIVGAPTRADGSCLLWAIKQSMLHLASLGLWRRVIPENVEDLRRDVIEFMVEKREYWTRPRFNKETGVMQTAPLDDGSFDSLIQDQRREKAWTDNQGFFVQGLCLFLDIELHIVCPNIEGEISSAGTGGPYMIINKSEEAKRTVFYVGLLKDRDFIGGHYQFLKKSRPAITQQLQQPPSTPSKNPSQSQQSLQRVPSTPSPLKIRRTNLMKKYLHSPEKKSLFKDNHCQFCSFVAELGTELGDHLKISQKCMKYYLRNWKVTSFMPILLKLFNCIFCKISGANFKLSNHLKKNDSCYKKHLDKFGASNLKDLQGKLEKHRRLLRPSAVNRKLELHKKRTKHAEQALRKTENDLINDFRKETSFSNCLCCFKCGANYCMTSKRILETDVDQTSIDATLCQKRRFQKLHCCKECFVVPNSSKITMMQLEDDKNILIYPVGKSGAITGPEVPASVESKNITCLLPCTVQCLEYVNSQDVKSQQQGCGLMYTLNFDISKLVSLIYENEVNKYASLKLFTDRYEGVILDSRTLKHAEKVVNDGSVLGSDKWRGKNSRDYFHRINQLGSVCLHIEISIPIDQEDVISTILLQEGHVVTVEYVGDGTNELERKYVVHSNHDCTQDCNEMCNKVPLSRFLANLDFDTSIIKTKYLSTYLTSVQMKWNSFQRNFVKAPSSPLQSDTFHFELKFPLDNSVVISGEIWLESCKKINLDIGKSCTTFDPETRDKFIKTVDSLLMATCDNNTLRETLKISNTQSSDLVKLVMKNQYHYCETLCNQCTEPYFPVLDTVVLEWSPNFAICQEFNKWILSQIKSLTVEEIQNLSTAEWMLKFFSSGELYGDIDVQSSKLRVLISPRILEFKIDQRMYDLFEVYSERYPDVDCSPLIGFYHYSVSTVTENDVGGVLLRRPFLRDMYVKPFNVPVLKALNCAVDMRILNGNGCISLRRQKSNPPHWTVSANIDEGIGSTHQEVSFSEALVMFDQHFFRNSSSNQVEYICTVKERKTFFKRVKTESEKSFKITNSEALFEHLLTNIERFFLRRVAEPKLCLCEFVMNYDFAGEKDSKDLFKLFTKQNVEIQESNKPSAYSDRICLPEVILLKNGDVMTLRSLPKVVACPEFDPDSEEHFFQQVLLYSPNATEDMTAAQVNFQYTLEDDPPVFDQSGNSVTIIQRIKRYWLRINCNLVLTELFKGSCFPTAGWRSWIKNE